MLTIEHTVSLEIDVRQSRFIAHAGPVDSEAATLDFYQAHADPAATHNCWAWKLNHRYRFNDDGEPASTAGKPILSAINGKDLQQVMVVVTRHFGGIKLGVGGLIRAYSGCAAKCLDLASVVEVHPLSPGRIEAGFEWTGLIHSLLSQFKATKTSESYTPQGVMIDIEIRRDSLADLQQTLTDATSGQVTVSPIDTDASQPQKVISPAPFSLDP